MAAMVRLINRNMRCIEMCICLKVSYREIMINRNMRCIEIGLQRPSEQAIRRLIETWDVLKWRTSCGVNTSKLINRNMRCIEIWHLSKILQGIIPINRNMRCIEIFRILLWLAIQTWLIETWDVLKWFHSQWWMMDCID